MPLVFYRGPIRPTVPPARARHPQWTTVRAAHIRAHPSCVVCGSTRFLEVHHIIPIELAPSLELEPTNLLTLCRSYRRGLNCHLVFGHLGDWSQYNPFALDDAHDWGARFHMKLERTPGMEYGDPSLIDPPPVADLSVIHRHPHADALTVDPSSIYQRSPVDRQSLDAPDPEL